MASFGEKLRQARTARNMTLQEVAASTKISSRALQALEDEHFDQLPGGIFNKGFVRAYAHCVGLDEEKMIAEYLAAANVAPSEIDMEVMSTQVSAAAGEPQPWAPSAATVVGVLALLVALGMGGLWLREHRKEAREQAAAASQAASAVPPASSPVPPAQTTTVAPDSIPPQNAANGGELNANQGAGKDTNQDAAAHPAAGATAGKASSTSARSSAEPIAPASTVAQAGDQPTGASAPVQVSISATERVWISVRSDGKTVESLTLDPEKPESRRRSYTANEKLLLVVGNPAGLSVIYNGKPTGVLGLSGQRAKITFTPEGMEKQ